MGNVFALHSNGDIEKEKLFRMFGVRTANAGDDNGSGSGRKAVTFMSTMTTTAALPAQPAQPSRRRAEESGRKVKVDRAKEQLRIEEFPSGAAIAAVSSAPNCATPDTKLEAVAEPVELESPPPPSPASSEIATSTGSFQQLSLIELPAEPVQPLSNPGTVAELHKRCHDIQPTPFEGLKFLVNKSLSNHFAVGHTLQLGKAHHSYYQFNVSYAGDGLADVSGESFPLLMGELDAGGNVTATLMHFVGPKLRTKFHSTIIGSEFVDTQLFVDYLGDDFTCSCILSNIDIRQRTGVLVASYLQQIVPRLALGLELIYQSEEIVPGGEAAVISGVARYEMGNKQWSGMISVNALELCYSQIYGESLRASVQLQANILKRQAITRLCYQCVIPQGEFNFRGAIDTRGVISAVCEKRLSPMPMHLVLSGKMNHLSNHFRFGLGIVLE